MNNIKIEISENDNEASEVVNALVAFNDSKAPLENYKPFFISARFSNKDLIGGIKGYTHWGWLFISHLWVDSKLQKNGVGTQLMQKAELLGKERGCSNSWLDTFSFQALTFYKKIGYEEFTALDNYPPGFSRHFLRKKI